MRNFSRAWFCAIFVFCTLLTAGLRAAEPATKSAPLAPGDYRRVLQHDGWDRSYVVHVPPRYDPKRPTPVVLAFHGAAMNAVMMSDFCGLNETSDKENFVVAYPNGTGVGELLLFFNASAKPFGVPGKGPSDDVGFTAALLDDLATVVNVDSKRVFATGMSNGGMMAHRLAAELSDRIAAIAPVAGTLALAEIKPARPVSVMHFHGTLDRIVPFNGPRGHRPATMQFQSVEATIQAWLKVNGCPPKPKVTAHADTTGEAMPALVKTYGPGRNGTEVVLVEIDGAGHTWPGRKARAAFIGRSTMAIAANDLMWAFFQRHPMK